MATTDDLSANPQNPTYLAALNDSGSDIDAFLFVTGGPSSIDVPAAATDPIYGVTKEDHADGERKSVQVGGVAPVRAGSGGLAEGDRVTTDTTGKGVKWNPASGVNASIGGLCVGAAASGKIAHVLLGAGGIGQGA